MDALFALTLLTFAGVPLEEDPAFQKGLALYDDLEFEQGIFPFQQAAIAPERTPEERARVQLWLGVSYGQVGDLEAARRSFRLALADDPEVAAPVTLPPKVDRLFGEVREEARKALAERQAKAALEGPSASAPSGPPEAPPAPSGEPGAPQVGGEAGEAEGGSGWLWWGGAGSAAALAAAAAVGGAALGGATWVLYTGAADPATTQRAAANGVQAANGTLIAASVAGGVAVLLVAAAGGAAALALLE